MVKMLIYDLVALEWQSYCLEYNNIKHVEVLEKLIKTTKKFHVFIVIDSHHLEAEEKQLVAMVNSIYFTVLINQNFILFFRKYFFNI